MNDILIPFLKKMFELSRAQSMLVQMSFFGAYFIGSLLYFILSYFTGDPITKIGYKKALITGLIISSFACFAFYPAAYYKSYSLFLSALFILGLGFTLLQIAANPYIAILGEPSTASSRLNLSQGFNSFGTTIAPIIGGYFVFHFFAEWGQPLLNKAGEIITTDTGKTMSALAIQLPYLIFAIIFLSLALLIQLTRLPVFAISDSVEKGAGALRHRHLILGMIAIFMYVGGEVSIGSVMINYINEMTGLPEVLAKNYLAFYWGGAMIGRFIGAYTLGQQRKLLNKLISMLLISVAGFFLIWFFVFLESESSFPVQNVLPYLGFIVLNIAGFLIGKTLPARTLMVFSIIVLLLLLASSLSSGMPAIWFVIGIGLFNSVMWSNIFTLAIKDLGKYTSQGSSLLVMFILGGAVLPYLQGKLADQLGGYHLSFIVPAIAYLYLAYYGWKGHTPKEIRLPETV
ncbi:MAG: sugar MFS transporter [Bacteroidales bacterium]|nr:sugar MFS transporter [Bacteroidales bacterium]MCB9000194.1 sugar MFS transporter [Bacteroidales bacterium]